jgi:hypothetical protein
MAQTVLTPIGFLYFPTFFTAQGNRENPSQAPRFSMMLLFDSVAIQTSAHADLRAAVKEAIAEKFGEAKLADAGFVRSLKLPFRDASEKSYSGFEDGEIFMSAWKGGDKGAPDVVDLQGKKISVPGDVWGGQLARGTVRPFAYDNNGNKGVSFGLEHAQIVKADMPRRDGQQSGEQRFAAIGGIDPAQAAALGIGATSSAPTDDGFPF